MKLNEIASHRVHTLTPAEPIARALLVMQEKHIQHLPVVRARVPAGMVSDHDVLEHVGWMGSASKRASATSTRVEKIMKSPIACLSPDDSVDAAARMMLRKHIGAVPLVENSRLAGIVTESDFLRFLSEPNELIRDELRHRPSSEFMSTDVLCVGANDSTLDTYRLMRTKQIRHLPVVEGGRLIGILSDRDILRGAPSASDAMGRFDSASPTVSPLHVRGIMSTDVSTLDPETPICQSAQTMLGHNIGALLSVNKDNEPVGILTETDLLRAFLKCYQHSVQTDRSA